MKEQNYNQAYQLILEADEHIKTKQASTGYNSITSSDTVLYVRGNTLEVINEINKYTYYEDEEYENDIKQYLECSEIITEQYQELTKFILKNNIHFDACRDKNIVEIVQLSDKLEYNEGIFYDCTGLEIIDGTIFPKNISASRMFEGCTNLREVKNIVVPDYCDDMFRLCDRLYYISNIIIPETVKDAKGLFYKCPLLYIDKFKNEHGCDFSDFTKG